MLYPTGYVVPKFIKFDGKQGNAREHVVRFIETLGVHGSDHSLRLREFSKSLTERAYSWYVNLAPNSIKSWEEMVNKFHTKFFQVQEKVTTLTLGRDVQKEGEDILDYVKRFQDKAIDCHEPVDETTYQSYLRRSGVAAVTSTGGSRLQGEASSSRKRKSYEDRNPYPCSLENVKALVKEWVANGELTLPLVDVPPTKKDKESPDYCIYHRTTRHPTRDCWTLKSVLKKKVDTNELKFKDVSNRDVKKDPYPNHKEKGRMLEATKAFINIFEVHHAKVTEVKKYVPRRIQEDYEAITFSETDRAYPFPHNRHLFVTAYINDVKFKRAFLDYGVSINIITTDTFAKVGILEYRMVCQPIIVTGFGGEKKVTKGHVVVDLAVGEIRSATKFHVIEADTNYHMILRRAWMHRYGAIPLSYHQCVKAKLEKRTVTINESEKPFKVEEVHYSDAVFFIDLSMDKISRTGKVVGVKLLK
ncbi:uncharacterized protein LOC114303224 [Camellia sinensis]|uniref:uncharacterized protein LOC114303224 n=1 Tax=Camellia sinensis TaxID=4442 RepID=UPI0010367A82|nr:uncharacterized protein LOC114303224 [Camellia sinensis]